MIAVLVPVLGRPGRAAPLVASITAASTLVDEIVFLATSTDRAQIEAARRTGARVEIVPFPLDGGDYARKINHGVDLSTAPWIFQAGDDLRFERGWDVRALGKDTGPHVGVIGTNDLGNPLVKAGRHATHSLIRRAYVAERGTIDEPGKALHEGYWHCWVDNELIETATHRRAFAAARDAIVEHLHPIWPDGAGGRKGRDDPTYRRGQKRYHEDAALFRARRRLWRVLPGR